MTRMQEYQGQRNVEGWREHWEGIRLPSVPRLWVPSIRAFHGFFQRSLPHHGIGRALEVGCCPGRWMAYFHRHFDAHVAGIDCCPEACQITRRNLQLLEVPGEVFEGDVRDPHLDVGQYDLVFSLGVIEHYVDLREILCDHARCTVPGGYVVVTMPNYAGYHGKLIRLLSPSMYHDHVPYTLDDLIRAAEAVGLLVVKAAPFGRVDPFVILGGGGRVAWAAAAGLRVITCQRIWDWSSARARSPRPMPQTGLILIPRSAGPQPHRGKRP